MSIVARGLGRGFASILVTAGLGLSAAPIPPTIDVPQMESGADDEIAGPRYSISDDEMFHIAATIVMSGILEG